MAARGEVYGLLDLRAEDDTVASLEAVQPVVQRQHETARLPQRNAATETAGQGINAMLPAGRIVGLQTGFLDVDLTGTKADLIGQLED